MRQINREHNIGNPSVGKFSVNKQTQCRQIGAQYRHA